MQCTAVRLSERRPETEVVGRLRVAASEVGLMALASALDLGAIGPSDVAVVVWKTSCISPCEACGALLKSTPGNGEKVPGEEERGRQETGSHVGPRDERASRQSLTHKGVKGICRTPTECNARHFIVPLITVPVAFLKSTHTSYGEYV